jgi:hypothetical protein
MPREYDLTALKPFDYQGQSFAEGESLRTGILGFIQLVGMSKAKLDRMAPDSVAPVVALTPKRVVKKRARRKKQA